MKGKFPDDENGDVLRRMRANGDDLSIARDIDFSLVFPDQVRAEEFARLFRAKGYRVEVSFAKVEADLPWDALVVRHMLPEHAAIGEFEIELESFAEMFGGRNDGWGCFAQKPIARK